jgi:hypothetical protein
MKNRNHIQDSRRQQYKIYMDDYHMSRNDNMWRTNVQIKTHIAGAKQAENIHPVVYISSMVSVAINQP